MPLVATVYHEVDEWHSTEYSAKTEVVVSSEELGLTHQAVECGFLALSYFCARNFLDGEVGTADALPLCSIVAEQQSIVGVGLEVLHVSYGRHVLKILTALQGIVGNHVADKPLWVIGRAGAVFPHQRHINGIGRVDSNIQLAESFAKFGGARCLCSEPIVA